MKISQEDGILIKKYLSVKAVWCTKAVAWIARQGFETWKHRQSAKENPQDGYNCQAAVDRVQRVAVEDLVLSQEDLSQTRSSAIAERPRDASCCWAFWLVTEGLIWRLSPI